MARIRYHVTPRDAPPAIAARALGLTLDQFSAALPALVARGFPPHDKTTGNYDLKAIAAWQDARYPQLLGQNTVQITGSATIDRPSIQERMRALAK